VRAAVSSALFSAPRQCVGEVYKHPVTTTAETIKAGPVRPVQLGRGTLSHIGGRPGSLASSVGDAAMAATVSTERAATTATAAMVADLDAPGPRSG